MGTWSQEFINVALFTSATPHLAIRTLVEHDLLLDEGERAPKVLYFPRVRGVPIWWVTQQDESLDLPPHITVMVAPGAMISALGAGGRLTIHGELQAPVGQIFPSAALPPPGISPDDIGLVTLLGDRLDVVHPEWWGGGNGTADGPAVDTHALEEAIRVAIAYSVWRGRAPTIELLGRYQIKRALRLFSATIGLATDGLEFRGRPGGEDDANLSAADGFLGHAMLELDSWVRVQCRNLRFDGRFKANVCVRVQAQEPAEPVSWMRLPHSFAQCGFRGGTEAGLQVIEVESSLPIALRSVSADEATPLVDMHGCMFFAAPPDFNITRFQRLYPNVAARLLGPRGGGTRFFNCCFVGRAAAMIHATNHDLVVTGCRFENTSVPTALRSGVAPAWREVHKQGPAGGVDIFLGGVFAPTQSFAGKQPEGSAPDPVEPKYKGGTDVAASQVPNDPPRPLASRQATLTAQDCRSSSLQFLVAVAIPRNVVVRDSTVIGLHHAFESAPIPDPLQLPPPILWMAREGVPSGPSLQLIGCRIDGDGRRRAPMVFAPDGGDDQPTVFDYGTSTDGRQLSTPTGHGAESFPGTFAPTAVGYVPFRR
ncbi:MAG: hypothetical protein U0324_43875 [Polyangiales bacterium]